MNIYRIRGTAHFTNAQANAADYNVPGVDGGAALKRLEDYYKREGNAAGFAHFELEELRYAGPLLPDCLTPSPR